MFATDNIGLITNYNRDRSLAKTKATVKIIEELGKNPILPDEGEGLNFDVYSHAYEELFSRSDFIITLGGDGTILSVAEKAAQGGIPVLGINIGNLGYLTDASLEMAEQSIKNVIKGNFKCERRMMLRTEVSPQRDRLKTHCCLNDACITRGAGSNIISFELFINNDFVDSYKADGIIISTPTGSTAYNLAAGGPILNPSGEMIAITPICPHMLNSRSIVASSKDIIKVRIGGNKKNTVISIDGKQPVPLNQGDEVLIGKSDSYLEIIKTSEIGFYELMRKKLIND